MKLKIKFDRQMLYAVTVDEGNRHMRAHGRKKWNLDDRNAAVKEWHRLAPLVEWGEEAKS